VESLKIVNIELNISRDQLPDHEIRFVKERRRGKGGLLNRRPLRVSGPCL